MPVAGAGELPAILLGGWAVEATMVAPVLNDWPGPVTVVSLDEELLLGCDSVSAVADALARRYPGPGLWLGWSMGAQVAMAVAQQHPDQVRALVTLAGFPCFVQTADWPFGMEPALFRQFVSDFADNPARAWQRFLRLQIRGDGQESAARAALTPWLHRGSLLGPEALHKGLTWLAHTDQRKLWREVGIPALHLFGERDPVVSARMAEMVLPPTARAAVISGMAHWPCLGSLDRVRTELTDFVATLPGGAV
ncbi:MULTISPECIES: alpha/beta fold hydrolase [Marinobacter]|uniref:Carboxylesterase n=1 Tax=Marinobacter profundi TaxID=2666256 RepID=A0A2G1UIV7_9GAMM|nr:MULTISPECIES: alpha/beta fold hydrolase [Marinobacter]MBD3655258.1 alpha/beta fold hydrolase [Marinobacter sp.]PHQ14359.1 carboxylesterase [Marinobacter profundi]